MGFAYKKAASPKKSMRLRDATLFCSNQDAGICFLTYSTHRDWSIPRSRSYSQYLFALFFANAGILHKFGSDIRGCPRRIAHATTWGFLITRAQFFRLQTAPSSRPLCIGGVFHAQILGRLPVARRQSGSHTDSQKHGM